MQMSENINELAKALASAQAQIRPAQKNAANPFHKSKYADLDDCWSVIRDPLSKNGLSLMQVIEEKNGHTNLVTVLAHLSGQWMKSEVPVIVKEHTPQSFGSALTYARRYGLCSIVGVTASDDDDGEAAEGRNAYQNNSTEKTYTSGLATDAQVRYMIKIAEPVKEFANTLLKKHGYNSFQDVTKADAQKFIDWLKAEGDKGGPK